VNEPAEQSPKKSFPKSRRVLRHSDFEKVYKGGRRHFAAHMTVFYLLKLSPPESGELAPQGLRIGFTVGKVLGGAVQRNRIRRRLREAVRVNMRPDLPADVVINPKRSAVAANFAELQKEVAKAFQVIEKALEKGR
jgi:ribonuclease P protein component